MKVTYEFNDAFESEDYYAHQIFQKAKHMHLALLEIETYIRQVKKGWIDEDKEEVVDKIFEVIYENGVGEIE